METIRIETFIKTIINSFIKSLASHLSKNTAKSMNESLVCNAPESGKLIFSPVSLIFILVVWEYHFLKEKSFRTLPPSPLERKIKSKRIQSEKLWEKTASSRQISSCTDTRSQKGRRRECAGRKGKKSPKTKKNIGTKRKKDIRKDYKKECYQYREKGENSHF